MDIETLALAKRYTDSKVVKDGLVDLSDYVKKDQFQTELNKKISDGGEVNQLFFKKIALESEDQGTLYATCKGSVHDSTEELRLDSHSGDLRISGVTRVVDEDDVTNKYYVDNAIKTKVSDGGEVDTLTFKENLKINSGDGDTGYVIMTAWGIEEDEDECLSLDTMHGADLRIAGVHIVKNDYDVANKRYVDDAINQAIQNLGRAEEEAY